MDETGPTNQGVVEGEKVEKLEHELEDIEKKAAVPQSAPSPSPPVEPASPPPASPQPVPPSPPMETAPQGTGKSKIVLWIGIALLVLALVATGAYYLGSRKNTPTSTPEPTPTQTPTPTPDPTMNWETHTNDQLSFSVKYPTDWEVSTTQDNSTTFSKDDYSLLFYLETHGMGLVPADAIVSTGSAQIGNEEYIKQTTHSESGEVLLEKIEIERGDNTLVIVLHYKDDIYNEEYNQIFELILSTFQFSEQEVFVCPEMEIIDCMPPIDEPVARYCASDYAEWIERNCPSVGIVY